MRVRATRRGAVIAVAAALLSISPILGARSFPISTDQSVLPPGTELYQDGPDQPRELFKSDAIGGRRSYLVDLGDMAFSSPGIFGGAARQAGMSCNTCHLNGTTNSKLFVPGLSTRPGNFDTTGHLFNAKADNGMLDPVTIPSLRGARFLAPYGHDGRMASLRDFVHNVVVNEFAGPEPSPEILDALVAYIQDIEFLPNPRLGPGAHLASTASDAERRGEALFAKPFPHDPGLSCAACHTPTGAFVDHQQHNVGSGGLFKTPTLLNANFNAPYFHDGRYDTYDEVVAHFDRVYGLGLSSEDRSDLVAYLTAVGDGERAFEPVSIDAQLLEISHFVGVLDTAIPAHNLEVISLTVDTVGGELRECTEDFPDRKDTSVSGGKAERAKARAALKELVLALRRVDAAASLGKFDAAAEAFADYRGMIADATPLLKAAEPWSLFNPAIRTAHFDAMRALFQTATKSPP
jgi:cytochrome c peroxidase